MAIAGHRNTLRSWDLEGLLQEDVQKEIQQLLRGKSKESTKSNVLVQSTGKLYECLCGGEFRSST